MSEDTTTRDLIISGAKVDALTEVLNAATCVARLSSTDDDWECVRASELNRLRRALDEWRPR